MAEDNKAVKSPYVPSATFNNFLAELAKRPDMLPRRIDKSLMRGMSGGTQSQLIIAFRFFGLVEGEEDTTHQSLDDLVRRDEDGRKQWMADALRAKYPEAMELSEQAGTGGQLAALFADKYGHKGSTRDKAIRFFLQMAQYAGVEVSPHFAVPRTSSSSSSRQRGNKKKQDDDREASSPSAPPGDTYQVNLLGGGTVTVTVAESHFNLSKNRDDRTFVTLLVDAMVDYAERRDQEVTVSPQSDQEVDSS